MRAAPPVQMICQAGGVGPLATGLLHVLTLSGLVAWMLLPGEPSRAMRTCVAVPFAVLAVALHVVAGRRRSGAATLAWDGAAWRCGDQLVRVSVQLDLGPWLLLRWQGDGSRASWLGLRLSRCGAPAHRCRAALYAHGGERSAARHE